MGALEAYTATLIIFTFIYIISVWGLNIQFGLAGILDFTYITFWAIGGYAAGVTTIGRPPQDSTVQYVLGLNWPFLPALVAGGLVAGLAGILLGGLALRRLRSDFLAIVMFSTGAIVYDIVTNYTPLLNGQDGIFGVPAPFNDLLQLDPNTYLLFYIGFSGLVVLVMGLFARRLHGSSLGRTMRAIREDVDVMDAFGKDTFRIRMVAMVIGCVYAGVSGALLIGFTTGFSPSGWTSLETFVIFAALIIGGRGNLWGAVIGAILMPVIFVEATRFLVPTNIIPSNPQFGAAIRNVAIGVLMIVALWFRPQGILPERKWVWRQSPSTELTRGDAKVGI